MSEQLFPDVDAHVIDTNLFVAFERGESVHLLERAVTEHGVVLLCPSRVYEELTPDGYPGGVPQVDAAVESGWVEVVEDIDYGNPVVSATMDMVRRYIAAATDREEHEIEQADAAVGGVTATLLERGRADSAAVYTHDRAVYRGIERALEEYGYGDRILLVEAFDVVDAIERRYRVRD